MSRKNFKKTQIIFGTHASLAAMANESRIITRVFMTKKTFDQLSNDPKNNAILIKHTVSIKENSFFYEHFKDHVHQGIVVETTPYEVDSFETLKQRCESNHDKNMTILVLDQVEDQQNLGHIIRNVVALGFHHILLHSHYVPKDFSVIAKVASGALEHCSLYHAKNIVRAIDDLKNYGFWSAGLDERAEYTIYSYGFPSKCILIFGHEGRGIRELVKKNCDDLVRIPTNEKFPCLNVSSSITLTLGELCRRNAEKR